MHLMTEADAVVTVTLEDPADLAQRGEVEAEALGRQQLAEHRDSEAAAEH